MDNLSNLPLFPYPRDATIRFGFIVGDILSGGVILLILVAIFPTLIR